MYGEDLVNRLKLYNQSGTVCALQCYYKIDKENEPNYIGKTKYINVGESAILDLDGLDIPDQAWVTAFAEVSAGSDNNSNVWFKFKKGNRKQANYTISGVINFTDVIFDGVEDF